MNKLYLGILIITIVTISWFVTSIKHGADYVNTIDQEVSLLEEDLVGFDNAVEADFLTPEYATEAKIRILSRLETITNSVRNSNAKKLSSTHQEKLTDSLNQLKNILIVYQPTLSVIEEISIESVVVEEMNKENASGELNTIIAETVTVVETNVEKIIDDYLLVESLEVQIDNIMNDEATTSNETAEKEIKDGQNQKESEETNATEDGQTEIITPTEE